MSTILFIALFVLGLSHLKLRDRVKELEKRADQKTSADLSEGVPAISSSEFKPVAIPPSKNLAEDIFTPLTVDDNQLDKKTTTTEKEIILFSWFREQTLIKIGGLFLFLGAAWFVSYAINAGWLSPEMRIVLGFALALAIYILAKYRAQVEQTEYLVLTAVGTGIMCATISAAQIVFDMFSPVFALSILAVSIGYTVFVAWQTNVAWLTLLSGATGLIVPLLMNSVAEPLWLLLYLLVLVSGLTVIGFKMEVRLLTLLMTIGVVCYEFALLDTAEPNTLWFFVAIFSALFFAGVTRSITSSLQPIAIDITTLGVIGLSFVSFASEIALSPSLAIFIATFVVGVTGYILAQRNFPITVISVFIATSGAGFLIGTSFLFSGNSLVLAYAIEVTMAFLAATYLGLPGRVIWIVALTYLLPLFGSLPSFISDSWRDGLWHADAAVVYTVLLSLLVSTLWLIHRRSVAVYQWSRPLSVIFGVLGFFYLYAVIAVVTDSIFKPTEALVAMYVLWAIVSLSLAYYAIKKNFPLSTITYSSLTLIFPIVASLESFSTPAWISGVKHPDGLGILSMILLLFLMTLIITQRFCKDYDSYLRRLVGMMLIVLIGYIFIFFYVLWHGLLEPSSVAQVAIYSSYSWVLYGLTSLFVLLRVNSTWIGISLSALVIPALMSVNSFTLTGWEKGLGSPDAVGLFNLIVIFILLALGLRKHYSSEENEDEKKIYSWSRILFVLTFVYTTCFVWAASHTIVSSEGQAISIALFIYTISGLASFQYGKQTGKQDFRQAGIALLTIVVAHLLLVDFKGMDILWRVITFLGIGALFIGTALLDKRKE